MCALPPAAPERDGNLEGEITSPALGGEARAGIRRLLAANPNSRLGGGCSSKHVVMRGEPPECPEAERAVTE